MTLLIDIGNTALKWAFTDARSEPAEVHVELHHDTDHLAAQLASAWALMPPGLAYNLKREEILDLSARLESSARRYHIASRK